MPFRRLVATLQLMLNALLPPVQRPPEHHAGLATGGSRQRREPGAIPHCLPKQFRQGVDPFLDAKGELQVFFPDCLAIAAPFVLFRLKRQGFSRCTVQASEAGLYVMGMR